MDPQPSPSGRFTAEQLVLGRTSSVSSSSSLSSFKSISDDGTSQSLASILNNPHVGKSDSSWVPLPWWSSSSSSSFPSPPDFAPLVPKQPLPDVSKSDFRPYLASISDAHGRFEDIRNHEIKERSDLESQLMVSEEDIIGGVQGQGEALVACLREVPALYFKEDFALQEGATFKAACPFSTVSENIVLQEKLSQYLDVVELHLVKEISLRSNSFFEAQGQLQDLNVKIVEGCDRIRELKETIRLLDVDLVDSARQIHDLNVTRTNLLALQQKLRLILYVNQALSALKLLVASADCAGALDITDDLQHLLAGDELTGLHCFRHLREHVTAAIDSINSILSVEFMRVSIHDAGSMDTVIISEVKARTRRLISGKDDEGNYEDDETSNFRDRLLPLIIGLLRTAKLPSVLRIYRDTLTADMKTAIKNAVAELLPVLVSRSLESDFAPGERNADADGGGSSLASKLRSLSSESFVQLLAAIFKIIRVHLLRAAEVKKAIEWIMCNLDGHYAADSVAAAIALGAAAAEESVGQSGLVLSSPQKGGTKGALIQVKMNDAPSPMSSSNNFRGDVLRENTEAVFAACDAAHGRWAKLLGVRALLHPKLRLQEFLSIYGITFDFINATEKIGGRLGYSIRGTIQSQAKAFVEYQHESRMAKIKAVLDQETWVEVDVPDEFQAIVSSIICPVPTNVDDAHSSPRTRDASLSSDDCLLVTINGPLDSQTSALDGASEKNKAATSSVQNNNSNTNERGKSTSQTLSSRGVGYHMMLSEYVDMNQCLPALSSEIVHRVVEILKFFNTRTCQLVLGAGAMQVSGLKSITAKHLALASQVISFTFAIIPVEEHYMHNEMWSMLKGILSTRPIWRAGKAEANKILLTLEIGEMEKFFMWRRFSLSRTLVNKSRFL
ncbi:Vacuolar protein sorting-associated protein 54, C-terminal [Dillenia turbinata]|uniref:Vacuolar protein sorting-associated protein 54, C-terminal n=1 Tax=Dillenia turbinata TaxID=194707 RepID=A0AAN8W421_9MAGN